MHNLIDFIEDNDDWEDLLKSDPYNLTIGKSEEFPNLYLLKYNQIKSDFSKPLVKESRGIILEISEEKGVIPVCIPFYKFFNYGEPKADKLDEKSIVVQEKVDGSIIKLYFYHGSWHIATNGTIDAFKTPMPHNSELFFGPYVSQALTKQGLNLDDLNKKYTYIFEFCSKWNKVVIDYGEDTIYHIGTRDNESGKELLISIGIKKPEEYSLDSLTDIIAAANILPADKEGYVVVDKDFSRVKVKSPLYLAAHRLKGNSGIVDLKRILEIVSIKESDEFLAYFPEYKDEFEYVQNLWDCMELYVSKLEKYVGFQKMGLTRKEIALMIQKEVHKPFQQYAYKFLDNVKEFNFEKITIDQLKQYFGV